MTAKYRSKGSVPFVLTAGEGAGDDISQERGGHVACIGISARMDVPSPDSGCLGLSRRFDSPCHLTPAPGQAHCSTHFPGV
jgi:hypothetical protein